MTQTLLDVEELAERLSVPASWVYSRTCRGALPGVKLGKYWRFSEEDVEEILRRFRSETPGCSELKAVRR